MRGLIAIAAGCAAILAGTSMAQDVSTNIGTLTCTVAEEDTKQNPQAATRPMTCAFKTQKGDAEENYNGTIRKVGTGRLVPGKVVLVWVVTAPKSLELKPGVLAQRYVGEPGPSPTAEGPALTLRGQKREDVALKSMTQSGAEPRNGSIVTVVDLELAATQA